MRTDGTTAAEGDTINMAIGYDADGDQGYAESIVGLRFVGGSSPEVQNPSQLRPNARIWEWWSRQQPRLP